MFQMATFNGRKQKHNITWVFDSAVSTRYRYKLPFSLFNLGFRKIPVLGITQPQGKRKKKAAVEDCVPLKEMGKEYINN